MLKTWNGAPEVVVARHRLHKEFCTFNFIKVVERCNNVIDTILELMVDVDSVIGGRAMRSTTKIGFLQLPPYLLEPCGTQWVL